LTASFVLQAHVEVLQRCDQDGVSCAQLSWLSLIERNLQRFADEEHMWSHAILAVKKLGDLNYYFTSPSDVRESMSNVQELFESLDVQEPSREHWRAKAIAASDMVSDVLDTRVRVEDWIGRSFEELGDATWVTASSMSNNIEHPRPASIVIHLTSPRGLARSTLATALRRWTETDGAAVAFAVVALRDNDDVERGIGSQGSSLTYDEELAAHRRFLNAGKWSQRLAVFPKDSWVARDFHDVDMPISLYIDDRGEIKLAIVGGTQDVVTYLRRWVESHSS
jgi:hypothetical protein